MSDSTLHVIKSNSQNDIQYLASGNTITINLDTTENDEVQRDDHVDDDEHITLEEKVPKKAKDFNIIIGEEFIKPINFTQDGRDIHKRFYWVQYVGPNLPTRGDPLDYSPESRNHFVLVVFSIVFICLCVSAIFVASVMFIPFLHEFFMDFGLFLMIPAMIIMIGLSYAMSCSSCTGVFPCNLICLILAVACMSIIAAYVTRRYQTSSVFFAVLATALVVGVCMCLACSSFDFTKYMLYVVVIGVALFAIAMIAFVAMWVMKVYIKPLHLGIMIVLTLFQVIVLTMELQMILGGRTVELGEEEYIIGAFMLYISIIQIFLNMVSMIGMFES